MTQPVRVLVVGGGSIGERHVRCFQGTGRATVALCEIDASRRAGVADRCRLTETFGDWQSALDWQPDVVVVATQITKKLKKPISLIVHSCFRNTDAFRRVTVSVPSRAVSVMVVMALLRRRHWRLWFPECAASTLTLTTAIQPRPAAKPLHSSQR